MPEYQHIQRFSRKLAIHAGDALRCFNCFDLDLMNAIWYKVSGVEATLCRTARSAQIRVSQEAGEILRPRNGGRSVARKSLLKVPGSNKFQHPAQRTEPVPFRKNAVLAPAKIRPMG